MFSHTGPIYQLQPKEIQAIIVELQNLSKKLLDDYVSALETSILSCFFKTPYIASRRSLFFSDLKLGLWIRQEGMGTTR